MCEEENIELPVKKTKKQVIAEQKETIAKLEQSLESEKNAKKYASESRDSYRKEINELHATFDAIGVPRKVNSEDHYTGKIELSLQARFSNYLQRMIVPHSLQVNTEEKIG